MESLWAAGLPQPQPPSPLTVLPENAGFAGGAVGFGDGADDTAGVAGCQRVGRDVPCDHAACADDAACSDGDTAAHGDVARQPAVIANGDGLAVFQIVQRAVCTPAEVAFLRQVGVHGREKGAVRTEEHVVADGDGAGVQYHEIEVGVAPLSKGGVDAP